MALWMGRVGRRRGFMTGAAVNIVGCAIGVAGPAPGTASRCSASPLRSIGIYNAIGLQYRFAAAEVAAPADQGARDLAGARRRRGGRHPRSRGREVVARPLRDAVPRHVRRCWPRFAARRACGAVAASTCRSRTRDERGGRRPAASPRSPRSRCSSSPLLTAALSYGLMNLLMTATPLAMSFCGHPFSAAADRHRMARRRHVRAGLRHRVADRALRRAQDHRRRPRADGRGDRAWRCTASRSRTSCWRLALVGVGWNFMYTGGTTLLTESYRPVGEGARRRASTTSSLFATMAVSSLSVGCAGHLRPAGRRPTGRRLPVLLAIAIGVALLGLRRAARAPSAA